MKHFIFLFFLLTILFLNSSCHRKSRRANKVTNKDFILGKVIHVIDGDTYDLLIQGNKTIRVRMEGIDAPEKGMPFYRVSKNYLKELCLQKQVKLKFSGKDMHERDLGFTYLEDGRELSHEMIKAGLAWHFKQYNSDSDLSKLEIEAQLTKKGLWHDNKPMPPWVNRKLHRMGISTKDSFNIKAKDK